MALARVLMRATEPRNYGKITAKHFEVLRALLWDFHNAISGLCFPSYEAISEKAGCVCARPWVTDQGAGRRRAANLGEPDQAVA
jgi:hypothetical protein